MKGKRTRINSGKVVLNLFKPTTNISTIHDYQSAKAMLHQGYSVDIVLKKYHLLESDKKLLKREEQLLNLNDPHRDIITELDEPVITPQFDIEKKIHNTVVGIFSSNENLRNFALPSVE